MARSDAPADDAPPAAVALNRSPSHLLHRALQHALDIYGEEAGQGAPTQRQFAVLNAVAAGDGPTQTDLVRATGIDRSTLADLVARMIARDLLVRERSASDARANSVRLTEAGQAALEAATPRVAAADGRILGLLPAKSRKDFLKTLAALSAAAEAAPEIPVSTAASAAEAGLDAAPDAVAVKRPKTEKLAKGERGDKKRKRKAKKS